MQVKDIPEGKELNKPFSNDKEGFSVYVKDSDGDIVLVRFSGKPTSTASTDPTTPQYWNEKTGGFKDSFKHTAFFDMSTRTIRSVRDGAQEYYGIEIGVEPADKVFTLYRSPETISNMASKLKNIPVTNDHVDVGSADLVSESDKIGVLSDTAVIELADESTGSTLCLENRTALNDQAISLANSGKKEFSLGYNGKLKPHDKYDFEQYDIVPTHLALVDNARGGSVLTFADKNEGNNMAKNKSSELLSVFLDAEGAPNLQQIVEIGNGLSEALKTVPIDELKKMLPTLQKIIDMGADGDPAIESAEEELGNIEESEAEMVDMDKTMEDMEGEEKEKFSDSKLFKSIVDAHSKTFADSEAFKTAVDDKVKAHSAAIDKAVNFVDEQYVFADKSTKQIMLDALKSEHGDTVFEDSELEVAFKLLKKSGSDLKNFGDSAGKSALELRIEKELEN